MSGATRPLTPLNTISLQIFLLFRRIAVSTRTRLGLGCFGFAILPINILKKWLLCGNGQFASFNLVYKEGTSILNKNFNVYEKCRILGIFKKSPVELLDSQIPKRNVRYIIPKSDTYFEYITL